MIRKQRATSAEGNPPSQPTDKARTQTTAATAGRKISRGFGFRLGQHSIQSHPDSFSGHLPRKHFSWSSLSPKCSFLHSLHQQSIEYSGHRVRFRMCTEKKKGAKGKETNNSEVLSNTELSQSWHISLLPTDPDSRSVIFLRINTFPKTPNITHFTLQWIT